MGFPGTPRDVPGPGTWLPAEEEGPEMGTQPPGPGQGSAPLRFPTLVFAPPWSWQPSDASPRCPQEDEGTGGGWVWLEVPGSCGGNDPKPLPSYKQSSWPS